MTRYDTVGSIEYALARTVEGDVTTLTRDGNGSSAACSYAWWPSVTAAAAVVNRLLAR